VIKYLRLGVWGLDFRVYGLQFRVYNTLVNDFNKQSIKVAKFFLKCYKMLRVYGLAFRF